MSCSPAASSVGWKFAAALAIIGGAAFYLRKRVRPEAAGDTQLTIVRRASIGLRSELLVVNVEGQRLLIGVTPHSIQSLAILDADEPQNAGQLAGKSAVGQRFAAMLDAASGPRTRAAAADDDDAADGDAAAPKAIAPALAASIAAAAAKPVRSAADDEDDVAGQARGLLALRRR